jgi:hypothetical protein
MTTSVLINRASAIHSSDAGHDDYICVHRHCPDGHQFSREPDAANIDRRGARLNTLQDVARQFEAIQISRGQRLIDRLFVRAGSAPDGG